MIISKELQAKHLPQIEKAFTLGNGDTFMQKDDFASIIAVKHLDVPEKELQGYTCFMLATITRECKPAMQAIEMPIIANKPKYEKADFNLGVLEEFPEFLGLQ